MKNKRDEVISIILTGILVLEIMALGGRAVRNRAREECSLQSLQCSTRGSFVSRHRHSPIKAVSGKSTLKLEDFLKRVRRQCLEESL